MATSSEEAYSKPVREAALRHFQAAIRRLQTLENEVKEVRQGAYRREIQDVMGKLGSVCASLNQLSARIERENQASGPVDEEARAEWTKKARELSEQTNLIRFAAAPDQLTA
jgi:hypothetical protein